MGYHRAGFEVVGVDIKLQPRYPFEFHQGDALTWPLEGFDAIHASPPCQAYSTISKQTGAHKKHPDLVAATRTRLRASGLPYVIENVIGSPLSNPIMLCGSSFGLKVRRHRLFECSFSVMATPCAHGLQRSNGNRLRKADGLRHPDAVVPCYGGGQAGFPVARVRKAMDIDWMTQDELSQAIPPAYTEYIGERLMACVQHGGLLR